MTSNDLQNPQEFTLQDALAELQAITPATATLPPAVFYGLSDISTDQRSTFADAWRKLDNSLRGRVARQLVETSEADFEFQYHQVAMVLLADDLAEVRRAGVELLWENDTVAVLDRLLQVLAVEREPTVKSEVLNALGRFIRLGEYEDIPVADATRAQDAVMQVWEDSTASLLVRRRALEAISNCTRDDLRPLIQAAYDSPQHDMRVSALYAMGRSCDPYWGEIVLREMNSDDPEMQYEAVRAGGEIELKAAVSSTARLAFQDHDRELQEVSIWALGEIGGDEATEYLGQLAEAVEESDPELYDLVEDAIHNAEMHMDLDALIDAFGDDD
jgi:hypothetical protein